MKTVAAVRHVDFEDLGSLAGILDERGFSVTYHDAGVSDPGDPHLREASLLIVLGGPMSANDYPAYPFLKSEVEAIKFRLQAGLPTLGICLGAQLIAKALGARVYPAVQPEIGWSKISLSRAGHSSPLRLFQHVPVFHWHNETFDLPEDAIGLASTRACPHQAFALARRALALQFHPEITELDLERWFTGYAGELATNPLPVQTLRDESAIYCDNLELHTKLWFGAWLEHVGLG